MKTVGTVLMIVSGLMIAGRLLNLIAMAEAIDDPVRAFLPLFLPTIAFAAGALMWSEGSRPEKSSPEKPSPAADEPFSRPHLPQGFQSNPGDQIDCPYCGTSVVVTFSRNCPACRGSLDPERA